MADRPASMADVAALAGVSVPTVSRALRSSPLVSPETAARVAAAAEQLSFSVSRTASSLATGKLNRIAVLVSGPIGAWFNASLLEAIYGSLHDAGQELLIYRTLHDSDRAEFFATLPARRNADALIVASVNLTGAQRARLRELAMPLVYVNQQVNGAPSVQVDDAAGTASGTRHLLSLGHRQITFVGLNYRGRDRAYRAMQRADGYRQAMAAAGIDPAEVNVLKVANYDDGGSAVEQILALPIRPTAVVFESDQLAMSAMPRLRQERIRVPQDLSLVGFDDHAMAAYVGLTTVAQPLDLMGREAVEMALTLAAGESPTRLELTVGTPLIARESSSPVHPRDLAQGILLNHGRAGGGPAAP